MGPAPALPTTTLFPATPDHPRPEQASEVKQPIAAELFAGAPGPHPKRPGPKPLQKASPGQGHSGRSRPRPPYPPHALFPATDPTAPRVAIRPLAGGRRSCCLTHCNS